MYKYTFGREQDASSPTEFSSLFSTSSAATSSLWRDPIPMSHQPDEMTLLPEQLAEQQSAKGLPTELQLLKCTPIYEQHLVPMDLSRGHAPNNWRGQGNGNWRQGRGGPPARGNVSALGYGNSTACFNCRKKGTMPATVLKRNSNLAMKDTTNKPTSSTWKRTTKTMK